jgi:hypothetical protein
VYEYVGMYVSMCVCESVHVSGFPRLSVGACE